MSVLSDALDILEFRGEPLGIPVSDIPPIEPVALWPGVVYLRQVTLLVAPGGTGKGLLLAGMAAAVTTGAGWPGEPADAKHAPGSVLIAAPEDDPNEDLAFRLKAAGANLNLVRNITYLPDGSRFTLPDNFTELQRAVSEAAESGPDVKLIILDPLTSMTTASLTTVRGARSVMDPLGDLARDTGTAIVVSHHTTKDDNTVAGSKALTDAARVVWMISRDKTDPAGTKRIMQPWKANRIPLDTRLWFRIDGAGTSVRAVFPLPSANSNPPAASRNSRLRLGFRKGGKQ